MTEYRLWPGSMAAIAQGCRCPVLDNARGSLQLAKERGGFWIAGDCPLHGAGAARPVPAGLFTQQDTAAYTQDIGSTGE